LEPGYLSSPVIVWLCLAAVSLIITLVGLRSVVQLSRRELFMEQVVHERCLLWG
jgi:hypothetical protein